MKKFISVASLIVVSAVLPAQASIINVFTDEQSWLNAVNSTTVQQQTPTVFTFDAMQSTDIRGNVDLGYNSQDILFAEVRDNDHPSGALSFSLDIAEGIDAISFSGIRSIDTKNSQGVNFDAGEVGISINQSAFYSFKQLLDGSVTTINTMLDLSTEDSVDSNVVIDFIGFVSATGIQSVSFTHVDPVQENVEDFRIDRIQTAEVSAPSILSFMAIAFGVLTLRRVK